MEAATLALVFGLPLLTLNTKHFARVQALRLLPLP
jgi:predicted nucleic acid-binding protein